jgi:hypothetical protein
MSAWHGAQNERALKGGADHPMKELTLDEMKLISGGAKQLQGGGFFPALIARLILGSLFFDFGADMPPPVMVAPQ